MIHTATWLTIFGYDIAFTLYAYKNNHLILEQITFDDMLNTVVMFAYPT